MGTSKKLSGKVMGYLILIGLVVLSWLIFKILTPHNFGSFSNMLNYFQASLIATVGAVGFYFVMVMGMFDFSIGANIMRCRLLLPTQLLRLLLLLFDSIP
mgnify:CR=1 FL=1